MEDGITKIYIKLKDRPTTNANICYLQYFLCTKLVEF